MKKTLWDLIKLLLPLNKEQRAALTAATPYLSDADTRQLRQYLKLDRTFPVMQRFHTSTQLFDDKEWVFFKSHLQDKEMHDFLMRINTDVAGKAKHEAFVKFAPQAQSRITSLIAHNIIGADAAKTAAAVQLFAKEPFHILMIGDPGTGKTDVLRSVHELAPISSFGLGSGTSGAGLSAAAKGSVVLKGLLPMADGGIACIDELNLMKAKDMAALYNAMEKGFVSYDKGTSHEQLPARVAVCATANPSGSTFIGRTAEILRKQIPFEDALLSRFHLIFIVRKPTEKEFEQIAAHIVRHDKKNAVLAEDAAFVKDYIEYAQTLDVTVDPVVEEEIVSFVKGLKHDEKRFLQEIGPRAVVGIVRIAKAFARAELAQTVAKSHVHATFELVHQALYVREPEEDVKKTKGKQ